MSLPPFISGSFKQMKYASGIRIEAFNLHQDHLDFFVATCTSAQWWIARQGILLDTTLVMTYLVSDALRAAALGEFNPTKYETPTKFEGRPRRVQQLSRQEISMPKRTKPSEIQCPSCEEWFGWTWDNVENEWELNSEWWHDPQDPTGWNFTCSRTCYLHRANERCDPSRGTHSSPHKGCILR